MRIVFGALAPKLSEQISGLDKRFDYYADAIARMHVSGVLTDAETSRCRRRLVKMIEKGQRKEGRNDE